MDEYVIVDRRRSVNVWTDFPDVHIAIESHDARLQLHLNLEQADRLCGLLNDAIAKMRNQN